MQRPLAFRLAVLLPALAMAGCAGTEARGLRITEVGRRAVELTLDEPSGRAITLGDGYVLSFRGAGGGVRSVGLGAFPRALAAGELMMVWSDTGYSGPVVAEDYPSGQQGAVPGIKIPASLFEGIDDEPYEVRLSGSRNRASGLIVIFPVFTTDEVDDVVRFGQPPGDRPASGGSFQPDGSLGNPSGSTSLARRWSGGGAPLDTDQESDWVGPGFPSWGVATP